MTFILERAVPGKYLNSPPKWESMGKFRAHDTRAAMNKARKISGGKFPVRVTGIQFREYLPKGNEDLLR